MVSSAESGLLLARLEGPPRGSAAKTDSCAKAIQILRRGLAVLWVFRPRPGESLGLNGAAIVIFRHRGGRGAKVRADRGSRSRVGNWWFAGCHPAVLDGPWEQRAR